MFEAAASAAECADQFAPRLIGIELGGTKAIVSIAVGLRIIDQLVRPTGDPEGTLSELMDWIAERETRDGPCAAIGLASFGPIHVSRESPDFGRIGNSPKREWRGFDVLGFVTNRFDRPIRLDTDVAAPALAEELWGGSANCSVHCYITVGTGIGVGIVANGQPIHGTLHPEFGHAHIRRAADDRFAGICAFHGDCIEGLASGPAIAARAGIVGERLPFDHPVWSEVARDLGEWLALLILTVAPQRIALGGGVLAGRPDLVAGIRRQAKLSLAGYLGDPDLESVIFVSQFGAQAGPLGSIALAHLAWKADGSQMRPPSSREVDYQRLIPEC